MEASAPFVVTGVVADGGGDVAHPAKDNDPAIAERRSKGVAPERAPERGREGRRLVPGAMRVSSKWG
jgi:hypothetical protein